MYFVFKKKKKKSASDLSLLPFWFFLCFLIFIRFLCKQGLWLGPVGGDGSTSSKLYNTDSHLVQESKITQDISILVLVF